MSHPESLQSLLGDFEGAYVRLWRLMTDVNTEIMIHQAAGTVSGSSISQLPSCLEEISQSLGKDQQDIFSKAAGVLSSVLQGDKELFQALGDFHQSLDHILGQEVERAHEAVVDLEKARERLEIARERLSNSMEKTHGRDRTAAEEALLTRQEAYQAQVPQRHCLLHFLDTCTSTLPCLQANANTHRLKNTGAHA